MGVWDSFLESARVTKGARWKLLGFWFVMIGVMILGLIALVVGVIPAILTVSIANALIFIHLKKQTVTAEDSQSIE